MTSSYDLARSMLVAEGMPTGGCGYDEEVEYGGGYPADYPDEEVLGFLRDLESEVKGAVDESNDPSPLYMTDSTGLMNGGDEDFIESDDESPFMIHTDAGVATMEMGGGGGGRLKSLTFNSAPPSPKTEEPDARTEASPSPKTEEPDDESSYIIYDTPLKSTAAKQLVAGIESHINSIYF